MVFIYTAHQHPTANIEGLAEAHNRPRYRARFALNCVLLSQPGRPAVTTHCITRRLLAACLIAAALPVAAGYVPPVGIPAPGFGIDETVASVYGDALYFTHFVDNTHPAAADEGNPNGSPQRPRRTIPQLLEAGSVVQVHGGPYTTGRAGRVNIVARGSRDQPVFITGGAAATPPEVRLNLHIQHSSYLIVEHLLLRTKSGAVGLRPTRPGEPIHHVSVRHVEVDGMGIYRGNQGIGATSRFPDSPISDVVFFSNYSHDIGDLEATRSGRQDDSNSFGILRHVTRAWILQNVSTRAAGDSVASGHAAGFTSSHLYIGGNRFYNNGENAVDLKQVSDIIISGNEMHGFVPTASSTGVVAVLHYGTRRAWFINNIIGDAAIGLVTTGSEEAYFVGNLIGHIASPDNLFDAGSAYSPGAAIHARGANRTTIAHNTILMSDVGIQVASRGTALIANNLIVARNRKAGYDLIHPITPSPDTRAARNIYFPLIDSPRIAWGDDRAITVFLHESDAPGSAHLDPLGGIAALQPELGTWPPSPQVLTRLRPVAGAAEGAPGVWSSISDRFEALYGIPLTRDLSGTHRGQPATVGALEARTHSGL